MFLVMRQLILFMHILFAISWVGGVLFIGWGVFPAMRKFTYHMQRDVYKDIMNWTHHLLAAAGSVVILSGILLGTVFGPLKHFADIWETTYGNIWFAALVIALFALLWGIFAAYPSAMKTFGDDTIWDQAESGNKIPLKWAFSKIAIMESAEVLCFMVLIYLMVIL